MSIPLRSDPTTNAGPKACAHYADLGRRKPFNIPADTQQRSLQRISHLQKSEAKEKRNQLRQDRTQRRCHFSLLSGKLVGRPA
jgi:hypothetical protein